MPVLIPTTTVTVTRQAGTGDGWVVAATTTPYSALPAHVSAPSGRDSIVGGDAETVTAVAYLQPGVTIRHDDLVTDDRSGIVHEVVWVRERVGLGLGHVHVGMRAVRGGASG